MTDNNLVPASTGTRLRLICIETRTSDPRDVTAIARTELEIAGAQCKIDGVQVEKFGADYLSCTPQELAAAANDPTPADVLVCHDAARTLELIPPALTGTVPWIGVGRLLLQAYPGAPTVDVEGCIEWLGLTPVLDALPTDGSSIGRSCAGLALVTDHVIRRLGLPRAIKFSQHETRPLAPPPTIDDDEGWASMPLCDVRWLATFIENARHSALVPERVVDPAICDRAVREYNRRRIWAPGQA